MNSGGRPSSSDPDIGYDVQKRYVRRDGGVIWVHVTAARIGTGEDGVLIAKTVEDVTDRVVADTAFRGFFENLPSVASRSARTAGSCRSMTDSPP